MNTKKAVYWLATLLLFLGLILALLPHAYHAKLGLGEEIDHRYHIVSGIILIIISLIILIKNQGARLSFKKQAR